LERGHCITRLSEKSSRYPPGHGAVDRYVNRDERGVGNEAENVGAKSRRAEERV